MEGKCAMRGACGSVGWAGQQIPCPYDGPPVEPETNEFRQKLVSVCGADYSSGPVCCTSEQVESLGANLQQAEALISSCPACRNNFRDFFCAFTCSADQASFLNVTSTQTTKTGETAVKTVDYYVGPQHGQGFYDSCKYIKFGATNGYAMELIGGGAKSYPEFFEFLGDLRPGLGSPFQINFPNNTPIGMSPYDPPPRSCSGSSLDSRCTCIDCPDICSVLPSIPVPGQEPHCSVGLLSCLTFVLILTYAISLAGFLGGYGLVKGLRKRGSSVRILPSLNGGAPSIRSNGGGGSGTPTSGSGHLVGATSLGGYHDDNVSLGRGASLLDPDNLQQRQYRLNAILRRFFYRLGYFCASNSFVVLALTCVFVAFANAGWKFFAIEKDPVRLWVAPNSESRAEMKFYDDHFGPFYRAEQIFVTRLGPPASSSDHLSSSSAVSSDSQSPILSYESLKWWFAIEKEIRALETRGGTLFDDVCFKPAGPEGACVVQSISGWFEGGDLTPYNATNWQRRAIGCAKQPVLCLPDFGQPLEPEYVLGGFSGSSEREDDEDEEAVEDEVLLAKSLVISFVVNNPPTTDSVALSKAEAWERRLRGYLQDLVPRAAAQGYVVTFSTGVSLEEELNKSTNTDIKTVVLSYVFMFLYVSLTLGRADTEAGPSVGRYLRSLFRRKDAPSGALASSLGALEGGGAGRSVLRRLFVHSKVLLGLFALVLVLTSITSSIGLFSYIGVKVTLIIAEVIPFLVLAVGVDNVFLLLAELERQNAMHGPNAYQHPPLSISSAPGFHGTPMSPPQRTRDASFEQNDPSSPSNNNNNNDDAQSTSAYLGPEERIARTLAKMGPSLLLSTITQTTAFALGALVPMPAVRNFALYAALSVLLNAAMQITVFVGALGLDLKRTESSRVDCFPFVKIPSRISLQDVIPSAGGALSRFFRRVYAPFLLHPTVKGGVIAIFSGIAVLSVISVQHIELGLDQKLALPSDSYLVDYFNSVENYLEFGPPVYFVVDGSNVTQRSAQQTICSRFTTCDPFSLGNTLEAERKRPEASFISQPPAIWLDEFLRWLDPALDSCCRVRKRNPDVFCQPTDSERLCRPCMEGRDPAWNITMEGLPQGEEFERYLAQWLVSPTDDECPLGGQTAYGDALSLDSDDGSVLASHFRTYHTPLRTQADFIHAYASAHRIADDLSKKTGARVFPYSVFYVFFEQYAHIVGTTQEILGLGLAAVLAITSVLLGSARVGTIVTAVVGLTVLSIMGVMGVWGVSLNAISLVNLVISLGIAVEFCSHVARGYMSSGGTIVADVLTGQRERDDRVFATLVDGGPSVLSGITFTKLIGILVLGFTRSKLLRIYYFRMWLSLIVLGALHGLVLLPVLLSLAGGPGYSVDDEDEEWMSSAIRRHDYEYTPFLADSESEHSDL